MPRNWGDIIEEVLKQGDNDEQLKELRTLLQDPTQMKDTAQGGDWPNTDMSTNPQPYETMNGPPTRIGPMPGSPNLDIPVYRGEQYDDSKTTDQAIRTDREMVDQQNRQAKIQMINPTERAVDVDNFSGLFGDTDRQPGETAMQHLYRKMPMQAPPQMQTPMQTPDEFNRQGIPKQYPNSIDTMQQLMQFYAGGTEI